MSGGGSVRDRIKAAEALEGVTKSHHTGHRHRGHKLALNTDEHIKEEFLRRGDGGWNKMVDIGQQEAFVPPSKIEVPFIKVTLETPVVESKEVKLPGKLPKSTFESISEEHEGEVAAVPVSTPAAPPVVENSKEKEESTSKSEGAGHATGKPAEKPVEKAAEKPVEKPTEKSAEKPEAKPVEKVVEKPAEKVAEKPAEKPAEKSAEKAGGNSTARSTDNPAHEPAEKPTEKHRGKPVGKSSEKTAGRPAPKSPEPPVSSPPRKHEPAVPTIDPTKREVAPEYAEDTFFAPKPTRSASTRRSSKKAQHARVDDPGSSHDEEDHHGTARGSVDFHDVDWIGPPGSRAPSRASSKRKHRKSSAHEEHAGLGIDGSNLDAPRSRSRTSRSKSTHREHDEQHERQEHHEHRSHSRHSHRSSSHAEAPPSPRLHRSHSRSGSTHKHDSESHHSPPSSHHRHSSNTLWPSWSQTERRSVSDILETGSIRSKSRPRSSHSRSNSTSHSTATARTDTSSKTVEFAEYFAGQKLEHTVSAPLSPPIKERPLGFVRSKSSTGEYHEYYTRDKHLLRKPDEDEVFEAAEHQKIHIDHHRHSSHGGGERQRDGDVPWQVKLMQGIARH